ncbi:ATP-binding protein [Enterobacter hormaechei]
MEDDGPGIEPAEREKVFEPFVRARFPAGDGGLPAAVVWGWLLSVLIAQAMGGSVRCEASELGGARFVCSLADLITIFPFPYLPDLNRTLA